MMIECPHCHMETEHKVIDHINIDRNPELRAKVQDLSVFRVKCPNCGETVLAVHPCLYHGKPVYGMDVDRGRSGSQGGI